MALLVVPQGIQRTRKPGFKLEKHSRSVNGLPAWSVCRPADDSDPAGIGVLLGFRQGTTRRHDSA